MEGDRASPPDYSLSAGRRSRRWASSGRHRPHDQIDIRLQCPSLSVRQPSHNTAMGHASRGNSAAKSLHSTAMTRAYGWRH